MPSSIYTSSRSRTELSSARSNPIPVAHLLSKTEIYTVKWESEADSLEEYSYESKVCSDNECSESCAESVFFEKNSQDVILEESSSIYLCVRIVNTENELTGKWNPSPALEAQLENIEITINNKVDTILQNMSVGEVLGSLSLNSNLENYTFKLKEGEEYFSLSGENNETVSLNKVITGQDLDMLTLVVEVEGVEGSETSFDFMTEAPQAGNNLLANGTFDDGVNSWSLNNEVNSYTVVDDNGNKYLQVTVNNPENDRINFSQTVALKANTSYMLSARMSGVDIAAGSGPFVVDTNDVFDETAQFTLSTSQAWTNYSGTFTTGPDPVNIVIRLFQSPTFMGQALYDEISLVEM